MPSASRHRGVRAGCRALFALGCFVLAASHVSLAAESATRRSYNLPADDAANALKLFSQQSGSGVIAGTDLVKGVRTNAVRGELTAAEALDRMLDGTGLVGSVDRKSGTFAVRKATDAEKNGGRAAQAVTSDRPSQNRSKPADVRIPTKDEVQVLSPFEVSSASDRGYQAENTLSGSRLNSRLRDTPASVSVFTPAFLQDVGMDQISDIINYSVNAQLDLVDTSTSLNANNYVNANNKVTPITIRGVPASQGMDYFKSITADDSYRIGRYDESRGPNGILFGISNSGGLLNQTSKAAVTHRDRGSVKHSTGSFARNRSELDLNKVLLKGKLAVLLAAVHQENGGWRKPAFEDKQRIFGTVVARPVSNLTIRVMGETGREVRSSLAPYMPTDEALAWLDNRDARGMGAVTFTPLNANPTAAQQAVGVTLRNSTVGPNRRLTYIENDGTIFDAVGTYLTGSYANPAVRAPDGSPGVAGRALKVNDPNLMPYWVNAGGPGMNRINKLKNITFSADWEVLENLFANFGYNYQHSNVFATWVGATDPVLRGDPNPTLGVGGRPNPYVGRLYMDGNWGSDSHPSEYEDFRLSLSYQFQTRRLGSHRVAGMFSRVKETDTRLAGLLGFGGAPFGNPPSNINNRIVTRFYADENDPASLKIGDWRKVPRTIDVNGRSYDVMFLPLPASSQNSDARQKVDTRLLVMQSHFFKERLVTTIGYRTDDAVSTAYGYSRDPNGNDVIDRDPAKATINRTSAITRTQGGVFHAFNWLSLLANTSSSVGLPDFVRRVFPAGNVPKPSDGKGEDYGISLRLFDDRITAKIAYFSTREEGAVTASSGQALASRNLRIMDAFQTVLVGPGRPFSTSEWEPKRASLTPPVNGAAFDLTSEGYEFTATANPTRNWRLILNYSYTDRVQANSFVRDVIPWYGFKTDKRGLVVQGVRQNPDGSFSVDPTAFVPGGAIARFLELAGMRPEAGVSTLTTANGLTVAGEIFQMIDTNINDDIRDNEQRWGLRPHLFSMFTAHDFTEGRLKGLSVGGGYRWRSANIIGISGGGSEFKGRPIEAADLMLRYKRRMPIGRIAGSVVFQVNVINLFDQNGIIPSHLSSTSDFVPFGGRGIAYSRFGLIEPRSFRFTTTYEF